MEKMEGGNKIIRQDGYHLERTE